MVDDFDDRIDELLFEASELPYADVHNQIQRAYDARIELIQTAVFSCAIDRAMVAFAWCQSQVDKNPEQFDQTPLLWSQKWIVNHLPGFPQYSRQQIMALLGDLETRFRRAGASMRSVYKLHCQVGMDIYESEQVRTNLPFWQDSPRDDLTDCEACDFDVLINLHTFLGEYEEAVAQGKQILKRRIRCAEVPHRTYASLLGPLFHLGRLEEAMQYHKKGYPMISSSKSFLASASDHLLFLVLTDNTAKAVRLFEKHLPWTYTDPDQQKRLLFLSAALRLLQTLEQREVATIRLRLPTTFSGYQSNGLYQTADVRKEIEDIVRNLARRFDQRNGSSGCSSLIQFQQQIAISPFPLSEVKKSASAPSVSHKL